MNKNKVDEHLMIRNMLNNIRNLNEDLYSNDSNSAMDSENNMDNVNSPDRNQENLAQSKPLPINDKTFPGILQSEKEKLSQKLPSVTFEENPFMYNPKNNTVTLTGNIQNMSSLKFILTTDTSTPDGGCYIFVEGLVLDQSSLQTLGSIKGYYDAWAKEWSSVEVQKKLNINQEQIERLQQQYNQ